LVPCRRFAACKKSLQMACNSPFVGKITGHFSPVVSPFPAKGRLAVQVVTFKAGLVQ
jgi:hypothetical protein